jgi:hypothetical protein
MTVFRPDTSFPYLKIAREHGVDYGEVIRFVEAVSLGPNTDAFWTQWMADAWLAAIAEHERRSRS